MTNAPRRPTSRRWLAGLVGLLLVAAACGGAREESSSGGSEGGSSPSTAAADAGDATFGELASPCGPAEGGAPGPVPTGQQGVADDSILIGYGDDAGYQGSPGLNHQMSDGIEAMMAWCNEQGGINGRTVEGNYYDAKILDANNAMLEACSEVFMLVGTGWALDGSAEQTRVGCDLPLVASFVTSPTVSMGPASFAPIPQPVDKMSVPFAKALADAYPEVITKATTVFADFPATVESKDRIVESFPEFGWEFLPCSQQYAISGESGWAAIVQRLKDCGAEAVYFTGAADPNFKNLLDAAAQADYEPLWFVVGNFTEPTFSDWNVNGFADNVYISNFVVPFSNTDNPATADYLEIVEGNGGDVSTLGAQAVSAFLLWATAVKDCGDDVTRECVVEKLEGVTSWDAGGLHAETNPGENIPSECGQTLRMQGTEFQQWYPQADEAMWDCNPEYVVDIVIPAAAEAEVGPDRKAQKYLS